MIFRIFIVILPNLGLLVPIQFPASKFEGRSRGHSFLFLNYVSRILQSLGPLQCLSSVSSMYRTFQFSSLCLSLCPCPSIFSCNMFPPNLSYLVALPTIVTCVPFLLSVSLQPFLESFASVVCLTQLFSMCVEYNATDRNCEELKGNGGGNGGTSAMPL